MFEKIKDILDKLYLKIKCAICCKSNCSLQLGQEEK